MSYEDVVDKCESILNTITGIGQVYVTEPRAETIADAVQKLTSTGSKGDPIKCWFVGHGAFTEQWKTSSHSFAEESVSITGIHSRSGDTSEETQRALIESIRTAFRTAIRADATLGGIVHRCGFLQGGAQSPVEFFQILCFRVELTLPWTRQLSA